MDFYNIFWTTVPCFPAVYPLTDKVAFGGIDFLCNSGLLKYSSMVRSIAIAMLNGETKKGAARGNFHHLLFFPVLNACRSLFCLLSTTAPIEIRGVGSFCYPLR